MNRLLFILLCISSISLYSQNNFPEVGSFWNYRGDTKSHSGANVDAKQTYYILRDTVVNGITQKIYRDVGFSSITGGLNPQGSFQSWDKEVCCMYSKGDSVFNQNGLNYVFNLQLNDTFHLTYEYYVVEQISDIEFDGDTVKKFDFKYHCTGDPSPTIDAYVIENVGPVFIEKEINGDGICYVGAGDYFSWHFECFSNGSDDYPSTCTPLVTGVEKVFNKSTEMIFDAKGQILLLRNLKGGGEVLIHDALGREVVTHRIIDINESLNLNELPAGVYIATVVGRDDFEESLKLVIQ